MKEVCGLYLRDKEGTHFPRLYSSEEYAWKVLDRYIEWKNNKEKRMWKEELNKEELQLRDRFIYKQYPPHGFYQNGWGKTYCISKLKVH